MRRLAIATVVVAMPASLFAQEPDRTLHRIGLALQQPPPIAGRTEIGEALRINERQMLGVPVFEPIADAPSLGPFTFVAPQFRGEFIRLALPVGEYLSNGIRAITTANERRKAERARRRVEADLQAWKDRSCKP